MIPVVLVPDHEIPNTNDRESFTSKRNSNRLMVFELRASALNVLEVLPQIGKHG